MLRSVLVLGASIGVLAMTATVALAQGAPAAAPAPAGPPAFTPTTVKMVKPGLFMIIGNGGNSTVRVGQDGVILVDTKNPGDAIFNDVIDKIKAITPLPVKYVFITHVHADHSGNTVRWLPIAPVIAADGEKALTATYAANPKIAPPSISFAKTYSVQVKGASAQAYHFNPAHTGGDTIVFFPDEKVVCTGDELVATTPNIDYPDGGSALGWLKNLAEIDKLDFDTAIPGHGNDPISRADFEAYRQKWETFVARARALVKAGTPKDQLLAKIKVDDLGWTLTAANWTAPARLDGFYAEMSQ